MEFDKVVWLLDPRFDFLLPWFEKEFAISRKDERFRFIGSWHGAARSGLHTRCVGNVRKGEVSFLEPEDINKQYTQEIDLNGKTLVVPFSGAYLPKHENLISVLSTGQVAKQLNDKWEQYSLFTELGIKTPKTWRADNFEQLRKEAERLLSKPKDCDSEQPQKAKRSSQEQEVRRLVLKKPELSGGYQMSSVSSMEEFDAWCKGRTKEQRKGVTLLSEYIPHKQSFAGMGLVREKDGSVVWYGATEQVLYHDFAYEGLIYPPFCTDSEQKQLREITCKVGEALAKRGYFGYFNVDFISDGSIVTAVELNARFGFGTLLLACQSGDRFWKVIQGQEMPRHFSEKRLILGKYKGRAGAVYEGLTPDSDITSWYQSGEGSFSTFFCGGAQPERFRYGSFIGLFGSFLPPDAPRHAVLAQFWNSCLRYYGERKTLLTMYVHSFCGFEDESFNFDLKRRYTVSGGAEPELKEKQDGLDGFPEDFFGERINALTLLIGENGSGKTTLFRLLIKWLCQLSCGKLPEERGALVFRADSEVYVLSFGEGEFTKLKTPPGLRSLESEEAVIQMLSDITLLYYTDTMTDLELDRFLTTEEQTFLTDYSLLNRIASAFRDTTLQLDPRERIKRAEFSRQMDRYLSMEDPGEYPIHYLQLSGFAPGRSPFWEQTAARFDPGEDLSKLMNDFGVRVFPREPDRWTPPAVLAWGLLTGVTGSLLAWEQQEFSGKESGLREQIGASMRSILGRNPQGFSPYSLISDIFRGVVAFAGTEGSAYRKNRFSERWEHDLSELCCGFLDRLHTMEDPAQRTISTLWDAWSLEKGVGGRLTWSVPLTQLPCEEWREFWGENRQLLTELPDVAFDWQYPSSGESNKANLMCALSAKKKFNMWYFLDEPDNAFHPEWKIQALQTIVTLCKKKKLGTVQFWIATHSPIMLSDVPKPAAILLKVEKGAKKQQESAHSPFGQQIYTLFQDSFFLKNGAIGAFAKRKIGEAYSALLELKKQEGFISYTEQDEQQLNQIEALIQEIDEPLLSGYLSETLGEVEEIMGKRMR